LILAVRIFAERRKNRTLHKKREECGTRKFKVEGCATRLEWAKFLEKWTVVPSLFVPGYSFPKDGELYQDLKLLNARRNSLVHLKEEVTSRGGAVLHAGLHPEAASDEHVFVGRCRSLPDKLLSHLASFDKTDAISQVRLVLAISPFMQKLGDSLTTG
jgi:hypothetical protein